MLGKPVVVFFVFSNMSRKFRSLTSDGVPCGMFNANCPHSAAKKATTRNPGAIFLQEHLGRGLYDGKVHVYEGHMEPTPRLTQFAMDKGMFRQPVVKKVGIIRV
jgi:hypothetical protein